MANDISTGVRITVDERTLDDAMSSIDQHLSSIDAVVKHISASISNGAMGAVSSIEKINAALETTKRKTAEASVLMGGLGTGGVAPAMQTGGMNLAQQTEMLNVLQQQMYDSNVDLETQQQIVNASVQLTAEKRRALMSTEQQVALDEKNAMQAERKSAQQLANNEGIAYANELLNAQSVSVTEIDNAIRGLSNYRNSLRINVLDPNSLAQIQEVDSGILRLQERKRQLLAPSPMGMEAALGMSEGSIMQMRAKMDALRVIRDQLTDPAKIAMVSQQIAGLNGRIEQLTGSMRQTSTMGGQLSRMLGTIFSVTAIAHYMENLVNVRGEFELQQRALEAILQNKDKADALFQRVQQLSLSSPFRFKELTSYVRQLAAYRIETDKLYDTTKMLGDVASGLGVDMQRVILAFGQVRAANYLRGQELRQFSESGINILGELADKFSQVQGRAVSTGEVFNMVSKRMVKFSDVEDVFKKLTKEGGTFYNMQEIQAETLKGKISNLKDAFDIFLNKLGTQMGGGLKAIVDAIRWLISKSDILIAVLAGITTGGTALAVAMFKASVATGALSAANIAATASGRGLIGMLARMKLGTAAIGAAASGPAAIIAAAIAAIAVLISVMVSLRNRYKEQQDAIHVVDASLKEESITLTNLHERIRQVDAAMAGLNPTDEKYVELQKQKKSILDELKTSYPQIYNQIIQQTDANVGWAKSIDDVNKKLAIQNRIEYLLKNSGSWFSDTAYKNWQDLGKAAENYNGKLSNLQSAWDSFVYSSNALIENKKKDNTVTEQQLLFQKRLADVNGMNISTIEKARKFPYLFGVSAWGSEIQGLTRMLSGAVNDYAGAEKKFSSTSKTAAADLKETLKSLISPSTTKEEAQSILDTLFNTLGLMQTGLENRKQVIDVANQVLKDNGIDYHLTLKKVTDDTSEFNKTISSIAGKFKLDLPIPKKSDTDDLDTYFKTLKDDYKNAKDNVQIYSSAKMELDKVTEQGTKTNAEEVASNKELMKAYEAIFAAFGRSGELESMNKGAVTATNKELKDRIGVLKQIATAYQDISKKQGEDAAKSFMMNSDVMKSRFEKAFKGTGISFASLFGDENGFYDAFSELMKNASEEGKKDIQDAMTGLQIKGVTVDKDSLTEIENQMQQLLDKFELRATLKSINIPEDVVDKMFGTGSATEQGIADFVNKQVAALRGKGTEAEKEADKLMQQLYKFEQQQLEERIKGYYALVTKAGTTQEQIAVVEERGTKERENILKDFATDPQHGIPLITASWNKQAEDIDKINFEAFKSTDEWEKMFGDLDRVSVLTIEDMIANLKEMKSALSSLSVEGSKEIESTINKLQGAVDSRSMGNIAEDVKKYIKAIKGLKGLKKDSAEYKQALDNLMEASKELMDDLNNMGDLAGKMGSEFSSLSSIVSGLFGDDNDMSSFLSSASEGFSALATSVTLATTAMVIFNTVMELAATSNPFTLALTALAAVISLIIGALKFADNQIKNAIKDEQTIVDHLSDSYDRLSKKLDKAYNINTIRKYAKEEKDLLESEIAGYRKMIALEKERKNPDTDAIYGYEQKILDLQEEITDNIETLKEKLGYWDLSSAVYDFADAWIEAKANGEDTLDALNDKMNDFVKTMIAKTMATNIVSTFIAPVDAYMSNALSDLNLSSDELSQLLALSATAMSGANVALSSYYDALQAKGFNLNSSSSSGLSVGTENITENTGEAIVGVLSGTEALTAQGVQLMKSQSKSIQDAQTSLADTFSVLSKFYADFQAHAARIAKMVSVTSGGYALKTLIVSE